jgi:hypothetical protein
MSMSAVTVSCAVCVSVCVGLCNVYPGNVTMYSAIKIRVSALHVLVDRVFTVHSLNSLRGFLIDAVRRTYPQLGNAGQILRVMN